MQTAITTTGTKLRKLRALNRLSAQDVEQQAQIPMSQLFSFELDDAYPSETALHQLADLYNVDIRLLEDDSATLAALINLDSYFPNVPVLELDKTADDIEKEREIVTNAPSRRERLQGVMDLYNYDAESLTEDAKLNTVTVDQLLSLPDNYDQGSYLTEYLQLSKALGVDPDYFTDGKITMDANNTNDTNKSNEETIVETEKDSAVEATTPTTATTEAEATNTEPTPTTVQAENAEDARSKLEEMAMAFPTVGERLKYLRSQSKFTNTAQVAQAANNAFSGAVLRNIEKGLTALNDDRRVILAELYGVNPDILDTEKMIGHIAYSVPKDTPVSEPAPKKTKKKEVTHTSLQRSKTLQLNRIFNLAEELFSDPAYTERDMQQLVQTLNILRKGR